MNKVVAILVNTLESGGAEKQSVYLYNGLKQNYKCYYIILYGERIESKIRNLLVVERDELVLLKGNMITKLLYLYSFLKSKNVTHLFTYLTKPNFLGSIIGRIADVENIYSGIRNSRLPYWKFVLDKISSNLFCTGTIVNNYLGEIWVRKLGLNNTIVIPNCFYEVNKPIRRQGSNDVVIITVGRFVPQKDYVTSLKVIMKLVQNNNNIKYKIVGYGFLERQIRSLIYELSLVNYVDLIINPNNISDLLNEADIYLSTSLFEGTSNSIMEAMNASLPVVATNVGDNNRLIQQGENGFLHAVGEYKEIAKSVELLIQNYELRLKFGIESNRVLSLNYSYEKFKQSYIQLIDR